MRWYYAAWFDVQRTQNLADASKIVQDRAISIPNLVIVARARLLAEVVNTSGVFVERMTLALWQGIQGLDSARATLAFTFAAGDLNKASF